MIKTLFLAAVIFFGILKADVEVKKAVFDLTTSSIATLEGRMIKGTVFTKKHYKSLSKELDAIVIIHGGAYKFFLKDLSVTKYKTEKELQNREEEIHEKLASLVKDHNVKFLMCGVGMKKNGIEKENLLEFVEVIPSAMTGLIDAQNDGYAFVPID